MLYYGCHNTIKYGIKNAIKMIEEISLFATVQIFLKSPMRVTYDNTNKAKFVEENVPVYLDKQNPPYLVVHGQYIINFIKINNFAVKSVVDDLEILNELVNENYLLNFKRGTGVIIHMGKNTEKLSDAQCIKNFGENVMNVFKKLDNKSIKLKNGVKLILETSTRTSNGNDIFYDIKKLGELNDYLRELLPNKYYKHIGYCIDTCHVYASNYDISSKKGVNDFIELWKECIGLDKITLIHLNDSKKGVGCCRDLHEELGMGEIYKYKKDGLKEILLFAKNKNIPLVSETAGDFVKELELVKDLLN